MTTVNKTKQKKTPNLGCEVDEVIGLVGEEEFERRPAQIVAPQVHLLQMAEVPFEIGALAVFAQSGVPEANESSRDFQCFGFFFKSNPNQIRMWQNFRGFWFDDFFRQGFWFDFQARKKCKNPWSKSNHFVQNFVTIWSLPTNETKKFVLLAVPLLVNTIIHVRQPKF